MDKNLIESVIGPILAMVERSKGLDQNVWVVTSKKGTFAVKIPKDPKKLENERLGCELCYHKEISAPTIVFLDSNILIETYVSGVDLDEQKPDPKTYFKLGKVLSKLHSIPQKGFGELSNGVGTYTTQQENVNSWFTAEFQRFRNSFPEFEEAARAFFEDNNHFLETSESVTLHGDLTDYNVRSNEDISLIDFGDVSAGPAMQDFAFMYVDHFGDECFEALLEGYGAHNLDEIRFYAYLYMIWLLPNEKNRIRMERMLTFYNELKKRES